MEREPYHYTRLFTEPIKIRYIGNYFRLPFAVAMMDAITFAVVALFIWLFFHRIVEHLSETSSLAYWIFYGLAPFGGVTLINKVRPEGKKIHYYLWDSVVYYFRWYRPKKKICQGRVVANRIEHAQNTFVLYDDNDSQHNKGDEINDH
ncbi:TcpE family conjugal transfer membrane protein [Enterococcus sp. DIV1420a]|uniref:TcpE family conjugal transfer membrane protein n=1 Tax=Enterococcus sp. DIV1420a TaxID=2774672 RepID=UPI0036D461CE